jgi:hypothetical protein
VSSVDIVSGDETKAGMAPENGASQVHDIHDIHQKANAGGRARGSSEPLRPASNESTGTNGRTTGKHGTSRNGATRPSYGSESYSDQGSYIGDEPYLNMFDQAPSFEEWSGLWGMDSA